MKKILTMLLVCMLFIIVGCTEKETTNKSNDSSATKTIGIAIYSMSADSCVALVDEANKKAEKYGYKIELLDANGDPATQADQMATFISEKVDGIILNPTDTTTLKPSIESAKEVGIPVIAVGMEMDDICMSLVDSFAGMDDYMVAESGFKWIKDHFEGQNAEVALLTGTVGTDPTNKTIKAMHDVLDGSDLIQVGEFDADWDTAKAMAITEDLLVKNKNIKCIFSQDHVIGAGIAAAIEDAGRTGEITVVSTSGMTDYLSYVEDGSWEAADLILLYKAGGYAVELLNEIFNGNEVASKYYASPIMVTVDNVKDAYNADFEFVAQ